MNFSKNMRCWAKDISAVNVKSYQDKGYTCINYSDGVHKTIKTDCYVDPNMKTYTYVYAFLVYYMDGNKPLNAGNDSQRKLLNAYSCKLKNGSSYCYASDLAGGMKAEGYTFKGWKSAKTGEVRTKNFKLSDNEVFIAQWDKNRVDDNRNTDDDPENAPSEQSGVTFVPVNKIKENTHKYYTIVYNLDGGKFIDGSSERTEVLKDTKFVGTLQTNPIKQGYRFVEWQLSDGKAFDFDKIITEYDSYVKNGVITLKAKYAKFSDYDMYSCPTGYDIFDPSTESCYEVLKPDNRNTYNYTTYSFAAGNMSCYGDYYKTCGANIPEDKCSTESRIFVAEGTTLPVTLADAYSGNGYRTLNWDNVVRAGKQNADYTSYGYGETNKDWWVSNNTCLYGLECNKDSDLSGSCVIRYDAIMYNIKDAEFLAQENEYPEYTEEESTSDPIEEEDPGDVKTGDSVVYIAFVLGAGALGYSIYYFNRKKQEEAI